MEPVIEDFDRRATEIRAFLRLLKEMERPGATLFNPAKPSHRSVPVQDEWRVVAKASTYLLVYNLVESAVRSAFAHLYEVMESEACTLRLITKDVRAVWIDQSHHRITRETASPINYKRVAAELVDQVIDDEVVRLSATRLPVAGNLDAEKIRELCHGHGVSVNVPKGAQGGANLAIVKAQRNALGHGEKSFSECGREVTVDDLERIAHQTVVYMRAFLRNVNRYIKGRLYARTA